MTNSVNDIRDIKGFVSVPHGWRWLWVVFAALAAVAACVWWWQRRKQTAATKTFAPLTAFEIAIRALQRLREQDPPVEQFYTRLSDIIRHYIEGQFGLRAPDRTTEEFLAEATLPVEHMRSLEDFLREADLVKFARYRPGKDDMARAMSAAETFIRRNDIPVATAGDSGRGRNAAPTTIAPAPP
jgi:hypothetical protein